MSKFAFRRTIDVQGGASINDAVAAAQSAGDGDTVRWLAEDGSVRRVVSVRRDGRGRLWWSDRDRAEGGCVPPLGEPA